MWFFGAVFLSQFPSFAKEVLHGNEQVASLLLVVFSVGIGIGSLLCEVLSRRHVEIGLVPLGAIGMTRVRDRPVLRFARPAARRPRMTLGQFRRVARALARDGRPGPAEPVRGPVQRADVRADPAARQPTHRARIIAANNILNALFMIASSVIAGAAAQAGHDHPADLPAGGPGQRGGGVLHLHAGAGVPAALHRLDRLAPGLSLQGHGRRPHPGRRARRSWCATT